MKEGGAESRTVPALDRPPLGACYEKQRIFFR